MLVFSAAGFATNAILAAVSLTTILNSFVKLPTGLKLPP